LLLSNF